MDAVCDLNIYSTFTRKLHGVNRTQEDGRKKKKKSNSLALRSYRQLGNLNCVVCLRGVTAGLAPSPGLLICAAHLSSAGALKFPLTHWGATSHTQHKRKKKERKKGGGGGGEARGPADSHLSPLSASQVPTGRHRLSVKSQVTTVWPRTY